MSVNKAILVGNVGNDPEIRHLEGGTAVANFSIATSESYKDKNGERITKTEWHNIVAWKGLAEIVEKYVKKGQQLYIEGKICSRSWEDKEGNKKYTTEIVVNVLQMLGKREGTSSNSEPSVNQNNVKKDESMKTKIISDAKSNQDLEPEDDLPF